MHFDTMLLEMAMSGLLLGWGILALMKLLIDIRRIKIIDVSIIMHCLVFGSAPIITFIITGGELPDATESSIVLSYIGIYLFILGLYTIRYFWLPSKNEPSPVFALFNINYDTKRVCRFILIIELTAFVVRFYIGTFYNIFMSGTITADAFYSMPIYLRGLQVITHAISIGLVMWAAAIINRRNLFIPLVVLTGEFVWQFARGRRFLLALLLAFVVVRLIKTAHTHRGTLKNICHNSCSSGDISFFFMAVVQ